MPICPHCNKDTITYWQKIKAGSASPAYCQSCGQPSSPKDIIQGLFSIITYFLFLATIFTPFMFGQWKLIIIPIGLLVTCEYLFLKFCPLEALTDQQVQKSKKAILITAFIIIVLIILAGLVDSGFINIK